MTNFLSNVKSALNARRGSNGAEQNTLSPEYSQNQIQYNQVPDTSSSIDLKSSSASSSEESKSKKELKAERKAAEQEELARLAAQARERGEKMKLDPLYLTKEFADRGLAPGGNDFIPPFGRG
ncbi:hypothetical protein I204_06594 [Kwoniella mangroviensis CBS 8886]|nr:hypothetical protein I204_06594 [Kwoniella mangroviensis CBS 8886]